MNRKSYSNIIKNEKIKIKELFQLKPRLFLQTAVLLLICLLGEILSQLSPIPFPAGVISMILLLVLLISGIIKLHHIEDIGDFLLKNMAFFFIPAGVSIIEHIPVLKPVILPFLAVCLISTFITFAVSSLAVRITSSLMEKFSQNSGKKEI